MLPERLRVRLVCLLLLGILALFPAAAAGELAEKEVLVVAGDENFPPYEFVDTVNDRQVYRGFDIDLLQAIALSAGREIQFRPMPWTEALAALERGEVDAIGGMKQDAERARIYDFSDPYMVNSLAIFVRKDTHAIASLNDLAGKKTAIQKNDISFQRLKGLPVELVFAPDQERALELLLSGTVDAVVGNRLTGQYILQRSKKLEDVKIVGGAIDEEGYSVAVKKGNTILTVFNQGLRDVKQNGTYDKLYAKWFGEPIDYPAHYYKKNFRLALAAILVLFIAATVIIQINLYLQREVKKRVREIQEVNDQLQRNNEYIERTRVYQDKMLNSGYSGIVTIGEKGKIKFANRYAVQRLSPTGQPLAGQHYGDTNLKLVLQGEALEHMKLPKSGEVLLGTACIEYTADTLTMDLRQDRIVYFRDITEEKQLREEVVRKDKLEALGKLVACIAHEIRNPLTSIKTFVELLPAKYDNPLFREKMSEFVPQEIERLNGIVSDLLMYAHSCKTCPERVRLRSLIDSLMVYFAGMIGKQEIDLHLCVDDDLWVCADVQQIKQVLINILLNAVQALEGRPKSRLEITGRREDKQVCLVIADNGIGIHPDHLRRLFEPFFSTKHAGNGLGLFVSYQLARQNGVQLDIASEEGRGTQVILKFAAEESGYA